MSRSSLQVFQPKFCMHFSSPTCPAHLILTDLITLIKFGEVYKLCMKHYIYFLLHTYNQLSWLQNHKWTYSRVTYTRLCCIKRTLVATSESCPYSFISETHLTDNLWNYCWCSSWLHVILNMKIIVRCFNVNLSMSSEDLTIQTNWRTSLFGHSVQGRMYAHVDKMHISKSSQSL